MNDSHLSRTADSLIADSANDILISPATFWEIAIKVGKKQLELLVTYDEFMKKGIEGNKFEILQVEIKHASLLTTMPRHHKDPFDRMIIAQVIVEQISVVSVDAQFDAYGVARLW